MRLKKHIAEVPNTLFYSQAIINKAIKDLSKRYKIRKENLSFQFEWDVVEYGGGKQLHFEVDEPGHKLHGSTVAYKI